MLSCTLWQRTSNARWHDSYLSWYEKPMQRWKHLVY